MAICAAMLLNKGHGRWGPAGMKFSRLVGDVIINQRQRDKYPS